MVDVREGRKLGGSVSPQFGVNCGVLQEAVLLAEQIS